MVLNRRVRVTQVKASMTLVITGAAGLAAVAAMATSAQAGTVTAAPAASSHACSFTADRLTVAFAHPYQTGNRLDQPLSVTADGETTCTLTGQAKIRLLDKKGKALPYRFRSGDAGVPTEVGPDAQAVFDLNFVTGSGDAVAPAKIRVTLPNGGGSRVIDWTSLTPATKTITVDGFRPWLD
jgi:Protein of unknown function (DUF4232)